MILKLQNLLGYRNSIFGDIFTSVCEKHSNIIQNVADGGAGVGDSAIFYDSILSKFSDTYSIYCYEPLSSNFTVLNRRIDSKHIIAKNIALSDKNELAIFSVPRTIKDNESFRFWEPGTSYCGLLREKPCDIHEFHTEIPTMRLDSEDIVFDFIKLDLQGGEYKALLGLGDRLSKSKLLYIEHRLDIQQINILKLLREYNFSLFFDAMQIGFDPKVNINAHKLNQLGLEIIYISYNPYYFKMKMKEQFFDIAGGYLPRPDIIETLKKHYGMIYAQTDVIAVNNNYSEILSSIDSIK